MPRPPISGALTIKWEDFTDPSDASLGILKSHSQDPLFLHLDPEEPVLYLNKAFEGLFEFASRTRRRPPAEHALHDETRGSIATEVWLSLFNSSVQSIEFDEEDAHDWPSSEWQETVLRLIFDRMFPEKTGEDALEEVVTTLRQPEGAADIQQRALPAIATHSGSVRLLRDAIRRIGYAFQGSRRSGDEEAARGETRHRSASRHCLS